MDSVICKPPGINQAAARIITEQFILCSYSKIRQSLDNIAYRHIYYLIYLVN